MSGGMDLEEELGPLQINYISIYESGSAAGFIYLLLFFAWSAYLVYLCKILINFSDLISYFILAVAIRKLISFAKIFYT